MLLYQHHITKEVSMSLTSLHKKPLHNKSNNKTRKPSKFLSALMTGISISTIGALSMTAPTLASAKTVQPSTADYSFTVEDKYKGSATRTLSKSGSTWKYNAWSLLGFISLEGY